MPNLKNSAKGNLAEVAKAVEKQKNFFAEMFIMVEVLEDNREIRNMIKEKLLDLVTLVTYEAQEGLVPSVSSPKRELLAKYRAGSVADVVADLIGQINQKYNQRNTPEEKWLDLKTVFLIYQAFQKKELVENHKLDEPQKRSLELVKEEHALVEIINKLNPLHYRQRGEIENFSADYEKVKLLIQRRIDLYREQGFVVSATISWDSDDHSRKRNLQTFYESIQSQRKPKVINGYEDYPAEKYSRPR